MNHFGEKLKRIRSKPLISACPVHHDAKIEITPDGNWKCVLCDGLIFAH